MGEEVSSSGAAWLTTGLFWLQNRLRVRGQRRCGRSGQIARTASACAGAGERGTDGESEAEKGARLGKDRFGADPHRPTRPCEDSAGARGPLGGPENRLGQSRPHPRPMWDRSLEDARRSDRSATGRADRPLPPLTRQRRSVLECARRERAPDRPSSGLRSPPQLLADHANTYLCVAVRRFCDNQSRLPLRRLDEGATERRRTRFQPAQTMARTGNQVRQARRELPRRRGPGCHPHLATNLGATS